MRNVPLRCLVLVWMILVMLVSTRSDPVNAQAPANAPTLRLPKDVRPIRQALELTVDPAQE